MCSASRVGTLALAAALAVAAPACRWRARGGSAGSAAGTAQLRGRVLSANGRVLRGAQAVLERESADGPVRVTTVGLDGDGDFVMERLPAGRYLLRTVAPGSASVTVAVELAPGDNLKTSLRFEPEQLLEGVVQDGRGQALPDALVLAWPIGKRQGQVVEAHSDREGRFALAGLPRGAWTMLAEAPGFGTLQLDRVDVPSRPLVLRLEGESRSLGGIVVAGNQPVAGARVLLGGPALRGPRTTTTDKRGTFLFHGIGLGKYTLRAANDKLASVAANQIIDDGTGWLPPFRLSLEPAAFLHGRVVDDTGQPLAGAPVEVVATPSDDIPELVTSDPHGTFSVGPVPPGRYQLLARLPEHVQMELPEVRLRSDITPSVDVRLTRVARLAGRVVDESGQPVVGVVATAASLAPAGRGSADELTVLVGTLPLASEAAGFTGQRLFRQGKVRSGISDDQGRFVVDMPPGRLRLELTHQDCLPLRREGVVLSPGERKDLGDLVVQPGGLIGGRVLDESGRPIEGARVEARPAAKRALIRTATDREGRFALRVPGGDYSLLALAPSRAPVSIFALHAAPGTPAHFDLKLPRAVGVIEGEVHDESGRPVSRANVLALAPVTAVSATPGTPWRPRLSVEMENPSSALTLASVATDRAGKFRLRGLPSEPVILEVRHPEWPPVAAVGRAGQRASLGLARAGGIEGEIREKNTGAFVARYDLDLEGPEGRRPERIEKQGAGFSAMGLQPGRWIIRVASPGFAPAEQSVDVPSSTSRSSRPEPSLGGVRVELSRAGGAP